MPQNKRQVKVIIFQPKDDFYHLPFDKRLSELEKQINMAEDYVRTDKSKNVTYLFLAPEYLFKNFAGKDSDKYFSKSQKNKFKEKLKELSMFSKMILIPGTICWKKTKKKTTDVYFRNALYMASKGKIQKYKKSNPHPDYDFDFGADIAFFSAGNAKNSIKKINDITVAFEICYDNTLNQLNTLLQTPEFQNKEIDFHVVIADGVEKPNFLENRTNMVSVKVERQESDKFSTVVLCHSPTDNGDASFEQVSASDQFNPELSVYTI